jgi:hypothetical protein
MRVALLVLVLLAAPALAGSPTAPEVRDAPNDAGAAGAWGDLLAGWFGATASDLTFTMRLAQLALPAGPYAWYVRATIESQEYAWWAYTDGFNVTYYHAHWNGTAGPSDYEPGTGALSAGAPGTIRVDLPRAFAANVTDGLVVRVVEVGTGKLLAPQHPVPHGNFSKDDTALGSAYTVATAGPVSPAPPPPAGPGDASAAPGEEEYPALTPGAGLAGLAAVAATLALVRRPRRRRR